MPSIPFHRPFPAGPARRPARLVVLGLLTVLLAAGAASARLGAVEISGTVTSVDGQPLEGARVSVLPGDAAGDPGAEPVAATSTDGEGSYELEVREGVPGSFVLRVEAEGYEPAEGPLELQRRRNATADVELVRSERMDRQRAIEAYNAGVRAASLGDLGGAVAHLEEAVEADPELAEARLGLAETLLRRGRAEEAVGHVEAYLEMRPEDLDGRRVAYQVYRELGDEEGVARAEAALVEAGAGAELAGGVYNRGVEAYRARDFDTAIGYFEKALELDPALADAAVAAAAIHYEVGRHAEAVRLAEEVLADDPENARAARVRFLALEAQSPPTERDPEADAALALYAELDPDTVVELLSEWAEEAFEADQRDAAQKHLERLLELRPGLPEAHYRLGLVHAGRGEAEQAKEHLGRFLELAPEHPEAPAAREILEAL